MCFLVRKLHQKNDFLCYAIGDIKALAPKSQKSKKCENIFILKPACYQR